MNLDFASLAKYEFYFVQGTITTLILSFITVVFGTLLGTGTAFLKLSKRKYLQIFASAYIEILRGTPLMVQVLMLWTVLGSFVNIPSMQFMGTKLDRLLTGLLALSINSSAYVAEIIRAGILSVDKGQEEAALSLGLSHRQSMRYVILPQAIKHILPALGNEFVSMIKESAILSVISVSDLMHNTNIVRGASAAVFEPLLICAGIYCTLTFSLSKGIEILERRLSQHA